MLADASRVKPVDVQRHRTTAPSTAIVSNALALSNNCRSLVAPALLQISHLWRPPAFSLPRIPFHHHGGQIVWSAWWKSVAHSCSHIWFHALTEIVGRDRVQAEVGSHAETTSWLQSAAGVTTWQLLNDAFVSLGFIPLAALLGRTTPLPPPPRLPPSAAHGNDVRAGGSVLRWERALPGQTTPPSAQNSPILFAYYPCLKHPRLPSSSLKRHPGDATDLCTALQFLYPVSTHFPICDPLLRPGPVDGCCCRLMWTRSFGGNREVKRRGDKGEHTNWTAFQFPWEKLWGRRSWEIWGCVSCLRLSTYKWEIPRYGHHGSRQPSRVFLLFLSFLWTPLRLRFYYYCFYYYWV